MMRPSWHGRIARARELSKAYPFAAEVLTFYAAVAAFQRDLYEHARSCGGGVQSAAQLATFRNRLELGFLLPCFPVFLSLIQQAAPAPLAAGSAQMAANGQQRWEELLRDFWNRDEGKPLSNAEAFIARAFLQPYAELLAEQCAPAADGSTPVCPICGAEPVVAVLRGEKLGARRSFICSFCSHEWNFPRGICPGCGEDRPGALSIYTATQFEYVRVDACDTCKAYIKTVDLATNGCAIPVVDELATVPLTLWALERGYSRLQTNLMAV